MSAPAEQAPARRRKSVRGSKRAATRAPAKAVKDDAPEKSPRRGAKRTVMDVVGQLPSYIRLLGGLMTDSRVAALDKVLVLGALAYIIAPVDLLPDFIPFLGQVDDVFLLLTALERLIGNAGRRIVLDHWAGDPADLSKMSLRRALTAATFFLPRRMRRRLRMLGRGDGG